MLQVQVVYFLSLSWNQAISMENGTGNQYLNATGRTGAEAPKLWSTDEKNWLIGKDSDAGKDWRQEEKGTTEDDMLDGITDLIDMSLS